VVGPVRRGAGRVGQCLRGNRGGQRHRQHLEEVRCRPGEGEADGPLVQRPHAGGPVGPQELPDRRGPGRDGREPVAVPGHPGHQIGDVAGDPGGGHRAAQAGPSAHHVGGGDLPRGRRVPSGPCADGDRVGGGVRAGLGQRLGQVGDRGGSAGLGGGVGDELAGQGPQQWRWGAGRDDGGIEQVQMGGVDQARADQPQRSPRARRGRVGVQRRGPRTGAVLLAGGQARGEAQQAQHDDGRFGHTPGPDHLPRLIARHGPAFRKNSRAPFSPSVEPGRPGGGTGEAAQRMRHALQEEGRPRPPDAPNPLWYLSHHYRVICLALGN
jgi:hypothetical protein